VTDDGSMSVLYRTDNDRYAVVRFLCYQRSSPSACGEIARRANS
jgi:hypothetical protein